MEVSQRARRAGAEVEALLAFFTALGEMGDRPDVIDLTFGNPHEMPLAGLVGALRDAVEPRTTDWFAYKANEQEPREVVAAALRRELGLPYEADDVALTPGAFGAIALAFRVLADVGDEVVVPVPGWFCYGATLRAADLVPVPAALAPDTFDLDLEAIDAAITPRTRIVVVNSPANPTGRVYPAAALEELARVLDAASARVGRRIWVLSDEPYRRIRFDGVPFTSPAVAYPWTLVDYSYGKVLLAPGQRLGYLAVSPHLPDDERRAVRDALTPAQLASGWAFADAVMQHSVAALEDVSIDMVELTRKRDLMLAALGEAGYRVTRPEGTFYLWGRAPGGDADAFAAALARRGVLVLSGSLFDRPESFRISLTATADQLEASLPAFREVAREL